MKYLPRMLWTLGQTLLPDHMRGLEESLLSDAAFRDDLHGVPAYGFSRIRFSDALVSDGLLTIEQGTITMRSGRILVIGENASVNTFNLNTLGEGSVRVYLHLMAPSFPEGSLQSDGKLRSDFLPNWKWKLLLSVDEDLQGTLEYLTLGVFDKNIQSEWHFSQDYMPPLLQVGTQGFFQTELESLENALDKYLQTLLEESANIQLSGENLINVRRCTQALRLFRAYILNVREEIHPHPYFFYERLLAFYLELTNYQNKEPVLADRRYRHDNLSGSLMELFRTVMDLLGRDRAVIPMQEFIRTTGIRLVELPDAACNATHWFILVQKQSIQQKVMLDNVKFASQSRLTVVHKYFLQGIPFRRVERPIFQHYFGPEVDTYEIMQGEEWRQALQEKTVAFLDEKLFDGVRFYLYWSQL